MSSTPSDTSKTSTSTATPYGPAQGLLNNLLTQTGNINPNLTGTETGALNTLSSNAAGGNQFAPQITGVANSLLGGGPDRTGTVNDAYSRYLSATNPTASGDYLDPNKNPWFSQVTQNIGNDVQNRLSGLYAGSGRDPAGAGNFGQTLGRGIAEGTAPVFANAYNSERDRQMAAITGQYGAGGQTAGLLSGLDQTKLGNQVQGIGAADAANAAQNYGPMQQLAVEAQRRGIPLQTLAQQMGIVGPAAQAFGSKSGTETSQTEQGTNWGQIGAGVGTAALMIF